MILEKDSTAICRKESVSEDSLSFSLLCWGDFPASEISHHGEACCEIALQWALSTDYSMTSNSSRYAGPQWIHRKYLWGPHQWPIHWCEAVKMPKLDCGALTCMTQTVIRHRGFPCFPVQLALAFDRTANKHWRKTWERANASTFWIAGAHVYHEVCGIVHQPGELRLWDPTSGHWYSKVSALQGYGAIKAIRLPDPLNSLDGESYQWNNIPLKPNEWVLTDQELLSVS